LEEVGRRGRRRGKLASRGMTVESFESSEFVREVDRKKACGREGEESSMSEKRDTAKWRGARSRRKKMQFGGRKELA